MKLSEALGIRTSDVVAFVGAGGKTSALFRLAGELAAGGLAVVTTTTTRIAYDEMLTTPRHLALQAGGVLPPDLPEQLSRYRHVFVYDQAGPAPGKVKGISPDLMSDLLAAGADAVLVEADGSRRLPLKAPYPHEPVIPAAATLVVPTAGLDALGQPLDDQHIYGAEIIQGRLGQEANVPVTPELIGALLSHPDLGLKAIPAGARALALLNKITLETLPAAREIARLALQEQRIEGVVLASLQNEDPVHEVRRRVGAVVLAAGLSRRMGEPKVLLPWGEGSSMIRQVCRAVSAAAVHETIVISGQWHDELAAALSDLPVRVVHNPRYETGEMLSSLQAGLETIGKTSSACLVVLGDQPAIQTTVIDHLVQAYAEGQGGIVAPGYRGQRGHPVLIDRAFWPELMSLPPDGAPRDVLRAHPDQVCIVEVDTDSVLQDIDTPEDYRRAQR